MARILIVEDDEKAVRLIEAILETMPDMEVLKAANGADGLRLARERRPDLILLDLMMPVMDGTDFLREYASSAALSEIPVIVITALAERERVVTALSSGARDYIIKPFDPPRLCSKVRELLEKKITPEPSLPGGSRRERPPVLVASAGETARRFVAETLGSGYEVIEAADGARGLHMVAERAPVLVLLGSRLPLVPSETVVAKIRAAAGAAEPPVVLLASAEEIRRLDPGFASRLTGTLEVPFTARALRTMVDRLLGRLDYYFYDRDDALVLKFQPRGLEAACASLEAFDERLEAELATLLKTGRRRFLVDLCSIDVDGTSRFKPIKHVLDQAGAREAEVLFQAGSPHVFDELRALGVKDAEIIFKELRDAGAPR